MSAFAQPVADAGEDVVVTCADPDGAEVTLDGSGSTGDMATFLWEAADVMFDDAMSVTPTGVFPPGDTVVTLTVSDESGEDTDEVVVSVEDGGPPVAKARAVPRVLWPPNHKLRDVHVRIRVRDDCTQDPTVTLVSVESSEPDNGRGDGNTSDDIQDAELGTDDRWVKLRAERSGNGDGRVYTLTYMVEDAAGNTTDAVARVWVPHDQADRDDKRDGDRPKPGDLGDLLDICPLPTEAVDEIEDFLPEPDDFDAPRACAAACRNWVRACGQIAAGAAQCIKAEARAAHVLAKGMCGGVDRRERRGCMQDARRAGHAGRAVRAELARARAECAETGRECAEDCRAGFDD